MWNTGSADDGQCSDGARRSGRGRRGCKMVVSSVRGVIDRRILMNYWVDAEVVERLLPAPFRPKRAGGYGMAGVCLIRLREMRPHPMPSFLGIGSENAAHRIAVEWEENGERREGVYIPRRDTS